VEKVAKHEKSFGKKLAKTIGETVCLAKKWKNQPHDSSRGKGSKRGRGRKNFRGMRRRHNQGERYDLHGNRCGKNGSHKSKDYRNPWKG
jgi:hypothetical protein